MNTINLKVVVVSDNDYNPPFPPSTYTSPPNNYYLICSHCNKNPCPAANAPRACGCDTCGAYNCNYICPHDINAKIRKNKFNDILIELMGIFPRYE